MSDLPVISVIMPVFNGEKHMSAAIQSVLSQSFSDFELLIVDDGSTDHTKEIALSFNDRRIKFIQNSSNKGIVYSRNLAIQNSKGRFIANLDSDDIALSTRFEKQFLFFEKNPEYSVIGTNVQLIDDDSKITGSIDYTSFNHPIKENLFFYNCFAQSSTMIRKECLKKFDEIYQAQHPLAEDYDLWVRLSENIKMINLPDFLTQYRISLSGISRLKKDAIQTSVKKIHEYQLKNLGLIPSDEQMIIHEKFIQMELEYSIASAWNAFNWIDKIISSNQQSNRYSHSFLQHSLKRIFVSTFLKKRRKSSFLIEIVFSELTLSQKSLLIKYLLT